MNKQKGFTIIELIVVIAIIAVLAGIVLVNVTSYINKSRNAAVKGNLSTMLTNA
ncbi:MAG: prepilin-type N-terminal cleavage/methylation domain-containing protein, partial [Candidatus Staskawiczbacteria bacterium]|nr:prepilin-type N-terminal cleavage/methylation domain-containing protein [Candidatus Staskawiczbacteria bacterium]